MRRKRMVGLLFVACLLTACKPQTLDEAIERDIPFNIVKIIHTEKVENGEIIFYITEQMHESEPIEALAVAFIKKDEKLGWRNVGNNHWDYRENSNMSTYTNTFYVYDKKGNLENRIPLIFGKIENKGIQSVLVAEKDGPFTEAELIHADGVRYFMKIGDYLLAKGLDVQGEIIEEYEKRS